MKIQPGRSQDPVRWLMRSRELVGVSQCVDVGKQEVPGGEGSHGLLCGRFGVRGWSFVTTV